MTDVPAQIDDADALMFTTGAALTVTVTFADDEHPVSVVPLQEYVVVALGLTVILEEVDPLLHK